MIPPSPHRDPSGISETPIGDVRFVVSPTPPDSQPPSLASLRGRMRSRRRRRWVTAVAAAGVVVLAFTGIPELPDPKITLIPNAFAPHPITDPIRDTDQIARVVADGSPSRSEPAILSGPDVDPLTNEEPFSVLAKVVHRTPLFMPVELGTAAAGDADQTAGQKCFEWVGWSEHVEVVPVDLRSLSDSDRAQLHRVLDEPSISPTLSL